MHGKQNEKTNIRIAAVRAILGGLPLRSIIRYFSFLGFIAHAFKGKEYILSNNAKISLTSPGLILLFTKKVYSWLENNVKGLNSSTTLVMAGLDEISAKCFRFWIADRLRKSASRLSLSFSQKGGRRSAAQLWKISYSPFLHSFNESLLADCPFLPQPI
jgi:hypothetical protein